MAYERINWQNLPSTATPRGATNLNRMDIGIADAHSLLGFKLSRLQAGGVSPEGATYNLFPGSYSFINGAGTQTLLMPEDPDEGTLVGVFVYGQGGSIVLDGNGNSVISGGLTEFPLVGEGTDIIAQSLWQYIGLFEGWVCLSLGIAPSANYIQGAGETGLALLKAVTPTEARAAVGAENPIIVTAAHTAAPGEFILCVTGGYAITIPEEAEHGDTITMVTDAQATGIDVTVEWWDIQQDTHDTTIANTGQQLTLRYLKDIDLGTGPVSGWYATKVDFVWGSASP